MKNTICKSSTWLSQPCYQWYMWWFNWFIGLFHPIITKSYSNKCNINSFDALQHHGEQVGQVYFEKRTIEAGIGVKNLSSFDFDIFIFTYSDIFSITSM